MGGGNFTSKLDKSLSSILRMNPVYKLRLNIDADKYAEQYETIEQLLTDSLSQTPFRPFEQSPELATPLILSYKYYYGIGTKDTPRLHLDRFENKAQFTLWLPDIITHDIAYLENKIKLSEEKRTMLLDMLHKQTNREISVENIQKLERQLVFIERYLNDLSIIQKHYLLENTENTIQEKYWKSIADWICDFEHTLFEHDILPGDLDHADVSVSAFFSLRQTASISNITADDYVPASDLEGIEQLKTMLRESEVYHLLLQTIYEKENVECKKTRKSI